MWFPYSEFLWLWRSVPLKQLSHTSDSLEELTDKASRVFQINTSTF
jgi:hypothetical protein